MKNYYWLKLHYDLLDDWKVGTLPDSLKWRFIQCLLVAGETNEKGFLPPLSQFAFRIRPMTPEALQRDLSHLASSELVELKIDKTGQERWFVTNYEKRQARKTDAERKRDQRERERQAKVTAKSQSSHEHVTGRDTDKIRLDKIRVDRDEINVDVDGDFPPVTNRNEHVTHIYDGHEENDIHHLQEVAAEIATVTKTAYGPGINEDKFQQAAQYIISLDAVDRIPGFAAWWQENGYYSGKPALKSFIDEFQNYLDGATLTNGVKPQQQHGPAMQSAIEYAKMKEQFNATGNN